MLQLSFNGRPFLPECKSLLFVLDQLSFRRRGVLHVDYHILAESFQLQGLSEVIDLALFKKTQLAVCMAEGVPSVKSMKKKPSFVGSL